MGKRTWEGCTVAALFLAVIPCAPAVSESQQPTHYGTLYVDQIDQRERDVFITYSYATNFPPNPDEILAVAHARRPATPRL